MTNFLRWMYEEHRDDIFIEIIFGVILFASSLALLITGLSLSVILMIAGYLIIWHGYYRGVNRNA